jgi:iron complex outermembrane receptor protein
VIDAIDLTSLGGVEVVKGNLSSLYANAPGGVINFVSDLFFPTSYVASVNQMGKFGLRQNGFRMGLMNNESRFLLSYNYRNLDGYRAHSNEYQHLVNAVYETYLPKSTVTVMGNFVNGLIKLPGSLTQTEYDDDPFDAQPLATSLDFKRITRKGRIALKFNTRLDEGNELEATGYGGIKELDKTDNQFYTVATRYSLGTLVHLTNRTKILNRKNVLTFGMDYAYQSGPVTDFDNLYGNRGISVQNQYNGSLSNLGFYFLNHYNLVPEKFDAFLSGRFDKDVFKRDIFIPYGFKDTSRVFQKFTPKLGLNFKIIPSVALYSSYGLSYDFPALSELANTPLSSRPSSSLNPDLDAQMSKNFELGIKGNIINPSSEFMRKLFFEVTFFNYIIEDEIVPFVINQTAYFRNAAKTNRKGVEIGIKSEPIEGIELTTNYTYTHFRYDKYVATLYSPSGTTTANYAGNAVPSVPKHILNLIVNYEFEISEKVSGLLQWDCDYIAKMYVDDSNSEAVSPFFYGNSMAGINLMVEPFYIVGYVGVNNIFDKRYVGFVNVNDFYGRFLETGEPRNVYSGLRISYKI